MSGFLSRRMFTSLNDFEQIRGGLDDRLLNKNEVGS